MKTIRHNTFETNSSSTHAIVIAKDVKDDKYSLYDSWEHDYLFGRTNYREISQWDEKLAYAHIVMTRAEEHNAIELSDLNAFINNVKSAYEEVSKFTENYKNRDKTVEDILEEVDTGLVTYDAFVDHVEDIVNTDFPKRLANDYEFVKRFIFNTDSYITIGGDEYNGYYIKTIGFEYDYEYHFVEDKYVGEFWEKLKEYEKTHDVYLKGN